MFELQMFALLLPYDTDFTAADTLPVIGSLFAFSSFSLNGLMMELSKGYLKGTCYAFRYRPPLLWPNRERSLC